MDMWLLGKGLLLGLSIAAPVGPVGLECIRRTLAQGAVAGFVAGLGAATADAIYGCVAGLGLTAVAEFLTGHQAWIRTIGGLFLCILGLRSLGRLTRKSKAGTLVDTGSAGMSSLLAGYVSILFLTLTNPMTIFSFVGIFSGLGLAGPDRSGGEALLLVAGVFCGSALWWLILSSFVALGRRAISVAVLRRIDAVSGLILIGFGVWALATPLGIG